MPVTGRAGDATATAITQAAAQLLARHQQVTVAAVAQATGVARGTSTADPPQACGPLRVEAVLQTILVFLG